MWQLPFPPPHLLQEAASECQAAKANPFLSPFYSPLPERGSWLHSIEHPQALAMSWGDRGAPCMQGSQCGPQASWEGH